MSYDFNSSRTGRNAFNDEINLIVDSALLADEALVAPRAFNVSPSLIGDECKRRIQYEITRAPGAPHPGKLLRIFRRGHVYEDYIVGWLRAAGFVISVAGADGRQHGFSVGGGHMRGRLDGIVLDGPAIEGLAYPCVFEAKVLGEKGWKSAVKDGVNKAHPRYADQISLYQAYIDHTNPALFCALNANTMELYFEAIEFDQVRAQAASDRAVAILRAVLAGEVLPRISDDATKFPCGWCRFKEHCWSDAPAFGPHRPGNPLPGDQVDAPPVEERPRPKRPNWLLAFALRGRAAA